MEKGENKKSRSELKGVEGNITTHVVVVKTV